GGKSDMPEYMSSSALESSLAPASSPQHAKNAAAAIAHQEQRRTMGNPHALQRLLSVVSRAPSYLSMASKQSQHVVHIIGGGLAGSEASWQIAARGVPVMLHEMRPVRTTAAHKTDGLAELVCSNSFRSDDSEHNAVGLLHEEMRRLGSLIMR